MNRPVIIGVIAAFLIILCSAALYNTAQTNREMQDCFTKAEQAALSNDRQSAAEFSKQLESIWEQREKYLLLYIMHNEIDEISQSISELNYLIRFGDTAEFCSKLNQLKGMVEHIWISELPLPKNLL